MKPLATLNRPVLTTVDVATKEETVSFKERTDVTAVPAMGVVAETMVALVLADEALRKFGGDSVAELAPQPRRVPRLRSAEPRRQQPLVLVGMMGSGKSTVGRRSPAARPALRRQRRAGQERDRPHRPRDLRADGEPAFRRLEAERWPTCSAPRSPP